MPLRNKDQRTFSEVYPTTDHAEERLQEMIENTMGDGALPSEWYRRDDGQWYQAHVYVDLKPVWPGELADRLEREWQEDR